MAAAQRAVAELQSLLEYLPELVHIAVRGAGNIDEVNGHDALVEAAVVLVCAVLAESLEIRGQEGAATHARVHIAVLVLLHLLRRDVVRHETLRGALRSELGELPVRRILADIVLIQNVDQLREGRGNPDTLLVLDAAHSLQQHFADDAREVVS